MWVELNAGAQELGRDQHPSSGYCASLLCVDHNLRRALPSEWLPAATRPDTASSSPAEIVASRTVL